MTPLFFALVLAAPPLPTARRADDAATQHPIGQHPPAQHPSAQHPSAQAPSTTGKNGPPMIHALFGVVTEQASLRCEPAAEAPVDEGGWGEERWGEPYYEIGFVRLVEPGFDPAPLVGRPVLMLGTPRDGPPPARPESCVAHQTRSDWVYGRHGYRTRRTSPPHVAFHPSSVTPLGSDVLSARRVGDQIEVSFHNPLDRPLVDLVLTLHHEGCYGKPLATERAAAHPTLAPGERFTARLPAIVDVEGRRGTHHAAASVTITATGDRVGFDLDVPLAALGAAVSCPDDPADAP